MKATELMIGDYVIRKNVPKEILIVDTIDSIRDIVYLDLDGLGIAEKLENIEPIPLTPEILEKNGFKFKQQGSLEVAILKIKNRHPITLEYIGWSDGRWSIHEHRLVVKYVHELQHVFRLCGIEKEIKL